MFRVLLISLFLSGFAFAGDDYSLLAYGTSIHSGCKSSKKSNAKNCDFNEFNPGLGVEWKWYGNTDTGVVGIRAGIYRDSFYKAAHFFGISYRKDWALSTSSFRAGLGVQAGYLNGSGKNGAVAVPMVTLGIKEAAIEINIAPKTNYVAKHSRTNVIMFSLRWQL